MSRPARSSRIFLAKDLNAATPVQRTSLRTQMVTSRGHGDSTTGVRQRALGSSGAQATTNWTPEVGPPLNRVNGRGSPRRRRGAGISGSDWRCAFPATLSNGRGRLQFGLSLEAVLLCEQPARGTEACRGILLGHSVADAKKFEAVYARYLNEEVTEKLWIKVWAPTPSHAWS
jgi:hypothetical protein